MSCSAEDSWEVTARKTDVPESESGDTAAKVILLNHSDTLQIQICILKVIFNFKVRHRSYYYL